MSRIERLHGILYCCAGIGWAFVDTVNRDIHVALNSYGFSLKTTLGKVVWFISCEFAIYSTGVLLVSNGEILCGVICACSDDSHEYTWIRYTHELIFIIFMTFRMAISFCLMFESLPGTDLRDICLMATGSWVWGRERQKGGDRREGRKKRERGGEGGEEWVRGE